MMRRKKVVQTSDHRGTGSARVVIWDEMGQTGPDLGNGVNKFCCGSGSKGRDWSSLGKTYSITL